MIAQLNPTRFAPVPVLPAATERARVQPVRQRARPDLACLLRRFAPISLQEMDGVALQDRTDTKYVFGADHLLQALSALADQYRVLEINSVRLQHYHTLYFDTDDWALYYQHHGQRGNRYKVRSRRYEDTDRACLEIKHKTGADRTIKHRVWTPEFTTALTPDVRTFLQAHLPNGVADLRPRLWNDFRRITLVSTRRQERLTVDVGLRFGDDTSMIDLPGIVVAEVKQAGHERASDFVHLMHDAHIRARGFSKYCIGVSLLYPEVKHNSFKPTHRLLNKLMNGENDVIC